MNMNVIANTEISQSPQIDNVNRNTSTKKTKSPKSPKKKLKWYSIPLIILYVLLGILSVLIITVLILHSLYISVYVDGESMQPTLQNGDYLYMRKNTTPKHDDIIVIQADVNAEPILVIKRVIGLEGDRLYQDNQRLMRQRAGSDTSEDCGAIGSYHTDFDEVLVEVGQVFVCGDNRENSLDSRSTSFGQLSLENLQGVVTPWSIRHKAQITKITQFFNKNRLFSSRKIEEKGAYYGENGYCTTV